MPADRPAAARAHAFLAQAAALRSSLAVAHVPMDALVPCGRPHGEHFVPARALVAHLRCCHRVQHPPRPPVAREFLYARGASDAEDAQADAADPPPVEPTPAPAERGRAAALDPEVARVAAAVAALAPDAGAFYERVRAWRAVPRALERLPPLAGGGGEETLVDRRKLERWLATEVGQCLAASPGQASAAEAAAVDAELGEYVAGLLEHADYCDSALLCVELAEFLDDQAAEFVLALWKFLVVEIGLVLVFNQAKAADAPPQQIEAAQKHRPTQDAALEGESKARNSRGATASDSRDYKRCQASYRGKVGTNTGIGALRELIAKHMAALSEGDGYESATAENLVLEGEAVQSPRSHGRVGSKQEPAASWWEFTDALRVRDMDRRGGRSLDKRRSGERSGSEHKRSRPRSRQREGRQESSRHRGGSHRSRSSSPRRSRRSRSRSANHRRGRDSKHIHRRSRSRSRSHSGRGSRRHEDRPAEARRPPERTGRGAQRWSPR